MRYILSLRQQLACSLVKILVLLGLGLAATAVSAVEVYSASGSAYNLKTGKLVYRELFAKLDENKQVHVSYARPEGIVFANKNLDYTTEIFQPGMTFSDNRDDEEVSAVFDSGRLLLTHKVKGDSQTKTLYETSKLVIDAGIDAFIQQQWAKLLAGKKVDVELVNARHLGIEKLIIKQMDASESPLAYKGAQPSWKYFRIDPPSKLSTLFAEPMYYAYESEGLFLMRYQGRANIDSDKGEMWDVRIEYEYW